MEGRVLLGPVPAAFRRGGVHIGQVAGQSLQLFTVTEATLLAANS